MKRNPVLVMAMLLWVCSVSAQYQEATREQRDEIVSRITKSAGEMETMQGDFTQVKELSFMDEKVTSEGRMYYKKTNKLRWEYLKPYRYVFSMDGQNVRMTSGDKTSKVPVKSSRMFGEISKVMAGGITGSGLVDSPDFDAQFMVGKDDYKIILTPGKKELKEMFSSIQLFVGRADHRIRSVELIEQGGDKTTFVLKNVQVNTAIDDRLFAE
ncbi:MAG: outer membrane lipoprotein carrier protein LolA [Tannerella sp.]|nr:outer membrane lipoprotein carrier protein LolA [Tannerella sp.]